MPIELESGNLQLTDEEISLYLPAAVLVAKAFNEHISLHMPLTRSQFTTLFIAHSIVTGDEEMIENITAVVNAEIAKRKRPH
jgi:hypothetical protein